MHRACWPFVLLMLVSLNALPARAEPLPSIFNGDNLDGWKTPPDNRWWKAGNGVLRVESDPELQASTLWTDKAYGNFIVELEFKMGDGVVDSGVFVRAEHEQIQIGISGSLKRDMTASPYIAGKGYPVEADGVKELLRGDNWNWMTIVAKGSSYAVWLNGKLVMTYVSETAVERGPIGLQLHGGNAMTIEFRNIRAAELD